MRYVVPLILVLASLSCSIASKPVAAQGPHRGSVITRIAGRHSTIVVRAGKSGPTYSLESEKGDLLVSDMTLGQLAMQKPELFQRVQSMQRAVVWAGLDDAGD